MFEANFIETLWKNQINATVYQKIVEKWKTNTVPKTIRGVFETVLWFVVDRWESVFDKL